jgi:dTDP-4-dehydrorhamnose 3,5-epimerase
MTKDAEITRDTTLPAVLHITRPIHEDHRGWFMEMWQDDDRDWFVQGNVSQSKLGVLRGLHFQYPYGQGKLVQVLSGQIWDVAVDVRRGSPTFLQSTGVLLDHPECQLYIPAGFAHGFYALSDAVVAYHVTGSRYHPEAERSLHWEDPDLHISWPSRTRFPAGTPIGPILSEKDARAPRVKDVMDTLPSYGLGSLLW